jgi:SAM-dependent methyltransferase
MPERVLEIGGGERPLYRPNMDVRSGPTVDIVFDLNEPWPSQTVGIYDMIYSAYLIEHLSWRRVTHFLNRVLRHLSPGGRAVIVTANLLEQCKAIAELGDVPPNWVEGLFGSQDYEGDAWVFNAHHCGFSPASAIRAFREAGFADVFVYPHPNCRTDMVIEARK